MQSRPPHLTAIVPVIALNAYGRRCIDALLAHEGVEVVLVSDDLPDDLDPRVVCVASGPSNTSVKRQLGLERARGPVVALIDDDAVPSEGWPEVGLRTLAADAAIGAVAGPTLTPPDEPFLGQVSFRIFASPLVSGPHRWRYAQVPARDVTDAPSVNLMMRRDDALAVGFDTPWAFGEDTILCERILERGWRIRYEPELVVLHSRRPLWRGHLRQLYRWSRRRGAFARAGGVNSLEASYFAPTVLVAGVAVRPLLRGRLRTLWSLGFGGYGVACAVTSYHPRAAWWWRTTLGTVATHLTYGVGFAISMLGLPLPEART